MPWRIVIIIMQPHWTGLKQPQEPFPLVLPRLCLRRAEDTLSATTCAVSDDHITMATQEQWGGDSKKRCVKRLERRLVQQSGATHSLIHLLSPEHMLSHFTHCHVGVASRVWEEKLYPKYENAVSCRVYTVSTVETDCVAKHFRPHFSSLLSWRQNRGQRWISSLEHVTSMLSNQAAPSVTIHTAHVTFDTNQSCHDSIGNTVKEELDECVL